MAKYKIRSGFIAHVKDPEDGTVQSYGEGKIVELTDEQFAEHEHQVEPLLAVKEAIK